MFIFLRQRRVRPHCRWLAPDEWRAPQHHKSQRCYLSAVVLHSFQWKQTAGCKGFEQIHHWRLNICYEETHPGHNGSKVKSEQVPCGAGVLQDHLTKIHLKAKETFAWKNPFSHTTSNNVGCSTTLVVLDGLPWNGFHRLEIANFGNPLTLCLAPPWGGLKWNYSTAIGWIFMTFGTDMLPLGRTVKTFTYHLGSLTLDYFGYM